MITTINLVSILHHILHPLFLVMRTFKIYYFSSFQICNTVLPTTVVMLHAHSQDLFFCNWRFVPFDHLHPFYPSPTPHLWQTPICSLYLWTCFLFVFVDFTCKWDHTVWSEVWSYDQSFLDLFNSVIPSNSIRNLYEFSYCFQAFLRFSKGIYIINIRMTLLLSIFYRVYYK